MTDTGPLAPIEALVQRWWQIGPRDVDARSLLTQLRAALAEAQQAVGALVAEREQRHDDQCESEYVTGAHAWTPCGCWASRSEAEGLMHRAEKAEAERDAARAKVAESRALPCDGGCVEAPEEDCSRHGRTPADLWRIIDEVRAERDDAREALARVEALAASDSAAMDLWWRTTGDDWAVPEWLPGRFLRAALAQPATDEGAGQ